jgi:cytochrome P450/NADPH-cytochrome P450 reductase
MQIFVRTRPSQEAFHLPATPDVPVTMVAAGTGIAPFLGFLEERKAQGLKLASHGGTAAQCKLYYGTSERDMSELKK